MPVKSYKRFDSFILFAGLFGILAMQNAFATDDRDLIAELGNATYSGIEEQPVTLADGRWEGAPYAEGGASRPAVGLVSDLYFTGDLDADGDNETVVLLWQSAGGTGSYLYIAVMKAEAGGYVNIATALVGDRVKIRGGEISAGVIALDVLQTGENDPMCCPTMLATRSWTLKEGQLLENEMQATGTLSVEALEQSNWQLSRTEPDGTAPADAGITLSIGGGRVSGKSACNRYSATIGDGESPGNIIIGPAMVTRMACADELMDIESSYLASLSRVESFSFQVGSLALIGQSSEGEPFTMLFSAQAADTP